MMHNQPTYHKNSRHQEKRVNSVKAGQLESGISEDQFQSNFRVAVESQVGFLNIQKGPVGKERNAYSSPLFLITSSIRLKWTTSGREAQHDAQPI